MLTCLIREVRKELNAPKMKAVIGVLGLNGELETERFRQIEPEHISWLREFRRAMAAPAEMPEFKSSVAAVHTAKRRVVILKERPIAFPSGNSIRRLHRGP